MRRLTPYLWVLVFPFLLALECGDQITPPDEDNEEFDYHDFIVERFGADIRDICLTIDDDDVENGDLIIVAEGGHGFLVDRSGHCHVLFLMIESDLSAVSPSGDNTASIAGEKIPSQPAPLLNYLQGRWKQVEHSAQGSFTGLDDRTACTDLGEIVQILYTGGTEGEVIFQAPSGRSFSDVDAGGSNEGPVLAVGPGGLIFHRFEGSEFVDQSIDGGPDFSAVHSNCSIYTEECFAYAVGGSEIWKYDDGSWARVYEGAGGELRDIAIFSGDRALAVGSNGTYIEFDGMTWSEVSLGADLDLIAAAVRPTGSVELACSDNRLFKSTLHGWEELELRHREDWSDLHSASTGSMYAASGDTLLKYTGAGWTPESMAPYGATLRDLFVVSDTEIWAIGGEEDGIDDFLYLYDGANWSVQHQSSLDRFTAVWAGDGAVFAAVEYGAVWRNLGIEWEMMIVNNDIHDFDGTGLDDLLAVGEGGLILSYHEDGWIELALTGETLRAISGPVAVGDAGSVWLRDGETWFPVDTGVDLDIYDVWYGGADNIWAVGESAGVVHYDGMIWKRLLTHLPGVDFHTVWKYGANVWIGGSEGYLLRSSD
jgi:hypothetical protein